LGGTTYEVEYLPLLAGLSQSANAVLSNSVLRYPALFEGHSLRWYRYPEAVKRFNQHVKQIQPDLIHAGPIHLSAAITALAGFHPLVSMSWGSDLLLETRNPWVNFLARYTLRRSDALVGDCQAVRKAAITLGMDVDRIVLFPWGTDLDHFTPGSGAQLRKKLGWQDQFVMISTRTFEPLYGVDIIVKAFIQSASQNPGLRLLMLGDGSNREKFKSWLTDAGVIEKVHFTGVVSREQLPDYYRSADLYLSASYSDGSSVSLLEAMACGLPVLVSDIPGNREWVEPGSNGWRFRSGEANSLVGGIRQALEGNRLQAMGAAARRIAEDRADWSENFPKLLEAYELARVHHARSIP
jgi:glycosyltransferase involved in cell wall biosynthesis